VLAAAALPPEALAERVRALPAPPLAVGDGAVRFRGPLEAAGALVPPDQDGVHRLRAEHVCRLGAAGKPTDRDALLPDYLREPDAVPRPR
jgi:tRNA threonylcarbamoyladenosine biosynthesis protein TsaB